MRFLPLLWCFACAPEDTDYGLPGDTDDDNDTDTTGSGGNECADDGGAGTPPEASNLRIEDDGMANGADCEGELVPMLRLSLHASDPDGDLHYYTLLLAFDTEIDGVVDVGDAPIEDQGTKGDKCAVAEADVIKAMCVRGAPIPFSTTLEFGAVLHDAAGLAANGGEPLITVFTTPDEEGNYAR